jgi:hypothetical protein
VATLRFVAALAARGRPADALAVARARRSVIPPVGGGRWREDAAAGAGDAADEAAAEAELGVTVRLECGLATEAFLVARDAVAAAPHACRTHVATALVSR